MSPVRTTSPTRTASITEASAGISPSDASVRQGDAWTLQALRSVWAHQRGRVDQRIATIERAAAALAEDRLETDLSADAGRAAHMLAGSLGMFGFLDASNAARELEAALVSPRAERAPQLPALLLRLRRGIDGPVSLCTAGERQLPSAS